MIENSQLFIHFLNILVFIIHIKFQFELTSLTSKDKY